MLTKMTIRNFKRFDEVEIELADRVVFVGPNNSGKTSSLQALALWDIGLRRWTEKHGNKTPPGKRPGATINRRDLMAVPVPSANLLWRGLHVRNIARSDGKQQTANIRIDIVVEGILRQKPWRCGLEFDYANPESFYCRPLRLPGQDGSARMAIPEGLEDVRVAFLPPMSGLAANETRLDPGAIDVRVGEGRTAEVLRNLCFFVFEESPDQWEQLVAHIKSLFG
ncbi:AAA family ATPase, partial [Candidatus Sumerlaeota bacterium]